MSITRKKSVLYLTVFLLVFILIACNLSLETKELDTDLTIRVGTLMGPTGMGMTQLMELSELAKTHNNYDFTVMANPDDLIGRVITGEVDVAALPSNVAAVLYQRTEGAVQLAAVNTLGVLYLLQDSNAEAINSIADLQGKTVNISGKGASPDFAFRYILQENNFAIDQDVFLSYSTQHADLATMAAAGDVEYALLPQPHVTTAMMRNPELVVALDLNQEWHSVSNGGSLAMGALVVNRQFAERNKVAFNNFLDEYQDSVVYVNNNIYEAAQLIEKFNILPSAKVAERAIPLSSIVYMEVNEARPMLEHFYEVLYGFEPRAVGGLLPDEGFWYYR